MGVLEDPKYPVLAKFRQRAEGGLIVEDVERRLREYFRTGKLN